MPSKHPIDNQKNRKRDNLKKGHHFTGVQCTPKFFQLCACTPTSDGPVHKYKEQINRGYYLFLLYNYVKN